MAERKRTSADRSDRFTWKAGDVEWVKKPPKMEKKATAKKKKK